MGAGRGGHPLLLLVALALAARLGQPQRWGGFQEKSTSAKNMNSTLAFYMDAYNNKSNDSYLFRVDKLLRSQVQVSGRAPATRTGGPCREAQPRSCLSTEGPAEAGGRTVTLI